MFSIAMICLIFAMLIFVYCICSINRREPWEDDLQEQFLKEWAKEHKKNDRHMSRKRN